MAGGLGLFFFRFVSVAADLPFSSLHSSTARLSFRRGLQDFSPQLHSAPRGVLRCVLTVAQRRGERGVARSRLPFVALVALRCSPLLSPRSLFLVLCLSLSISLPASLSSLLLSISFYLSSLGPSHAKVKRHKER